jgi:hypothetical protein
LRGSTETGSSESDDISFDTELKYGDLKADAVIHFDGRKLALVNKDSASLGEASHGKSTHTKGLSDHTRSTKESSGASVRSGFSGSKEAAEPEECTHLTSFYGTNQTLSDGIVSDSSHVHYPDTIYEEDEGAHSRNPGPSHSASHNSDGWRTLEVRNSASSSRARSKSEITISDKEGTVSGKEDISFEKSVSGRAGSRGSTSSDPKKGAPKSELCKVSKSGEQSTSGATITNQSQTNEIGGDSSQSSTMITTSKSATESITLNTRMSQAVERMQVDNPSLHHPTMPEGQIEESSLHAEEERMIEGDNNNFSQSSKLEAPRWWQNKYRLKMTKSVNEVIKNAFSKSHKNQPDASAGSPQDILPEEAHEEVIDFSHDDEEDDIFGGLEDTGSKEDFVLRQIAESEERTEGSTKKPRQIESSRKTPTKGPSQNPQERANDGFPVSSPNDTAGHFQPRIDTAPESVHSHDRSGTLLDESEVLHDVNSDITSSLVGGAPGYAKVEVLNPAPMSEPTSRAVVPEKTEPTRPVASEAHQQKLPKQPLPENAGPKDTKEPKVAKTPKPSKTKKGQKETAIAAVKEVKPQKSKKDKAKQQDKPASARKDPEIKTQETDAGATLEDDDTDAESVASGTQPPQPSSMFLNLSCGFVDSFTNSGICTFTKKDAANAPEDGTGNSFVSATSSVNSASQLTDLEKRVWSDWDRRDSSVVTKDTMPKKLSETSADNKEELDRKRQVARGKLLDYASSAISSQMVSGSVMTMSRLQQESSEYTDCSSSSGDSADSDSKDSKDSGSYSEGSDYVSDEGRPSTGPKVDVGKPMPTTPILLSFSQRSLVEKFTKNLATEGVEVLKLNRRKQWQFRYFTVSKEQIPLSAHETKGQTGDVAQCPKAILWLKKFNPKNGGYGLSNIDKNGHGGMLLLELTDVTVTNKQDEENPLPKKLLEKFKESVLVTMDYTMNGGFRSVSFRCKSNDEAQFLCTCMRVIRDLLKREQFLRLRTPTFVEGANLKVQC